MSLLEKKKVEVPNPSVNTDLSTVVKKNIFANLLCFQISLSILKTIIEASSSRSGYRNTVGRIRSAVHN